MPPLLSKTSLQKLSLQRKETRFHGFLCISRTDFAELRANKEHFLNTQELAYYAKLSFERRQYSYLSGRYCAKTALSAYLKEPTLTCIEVSSGVFRQPLVHYPNRTHNVQVSIAHSHIFSGALVFPEAHPMGLDIETVKPEKTKVIAHELTASEQARCRDMDVDGAIAHTFHWALKEALSKAVRCGMTTPSRLYEIATLEAQGDCYKAIFKNFTQYKGIVFAFGEPLSVCAVSTPKNTEVTLDLHSLSAL